MFLRSKARPVRKTANLTAICEPISLKMKSVQKWVPKAKKKKKMFLGSSARPVRKALQSYRHLRPNCLDTVGPSPSHNPIGLWRLLREYLYVTDMKDSIVYALYAVWRKWSEAEQLRLRV
jgi:hypothetical protein